MMHLGDRKVCALLIQAVRLLGIISLWMYSITHTGDHVSAI